MTNETKTEPKKKEKNDGAKSGPEQVIRDGGIAAMICPRCRTAIAATATSSAIDSPDTYRQALEGLSSLSYSRPGTYPGARSSHAPAWPVTRLMAPDAGQR